MTVRLANPRGFCAGVERAVEVVQRALERYGAPVYVLHEIVHNRRVLADLRARGARFVERVEEIPAGAVTIFSAHGVSDAVEGAAARRGLRVIDATCPLVAKVHQQARRAARAGGELIVVGHAGHPEVTGTAGRHPGTVHVVATPAEVDALEVADDSNLRYVTQTTLSLDDTREVVDALKRRFPGIEGPELDDICYATQNRQNAVREMLAGIDALVVVGSANSSNSRRLCELGERAGLPSLLIDDPADLRAEWCAGRAAIGLTAGASAPESLVQAVLARLRELGAGEVREVAGPAEDVVFRLPPELAPSAA
jgi:4-hydroxy-3-methylbut-2-enyl diphosphate reductase